MTSSVGWPARAWELGFVPDDAMASFIVGSTARGWNNARSDVDVYTVTTRMWESEISRPIPVPLEPAVVQSEVRYDGNRRWELFYWTDQQFDQMLEKVSWAAFESDVVAANVLSHREELALARINRCLPLAGEDWIVERRAAVEKSAFRSFIITRSLGKADDAVEDALGQMESGDLRSATISARQAFGYSVDALLEGQGEYESHVSKWRPNRFSAVSQDVLTFDEYWTLETMQGYDPADPRPWITRTLMLCQDIAMRVEVS